MWEQGVVNALSQQDSLAPAEVSLHILCHMMPAVSVAFESFNHPRQQGEI